MDQFLFFKWLQSGKGCFVISYYSHFFLMDNLKKKWRQSGIPSKLKIGFLCQVYLGIDKSLSLGIDK